MEFNVHPWGTWSFGVRYKYLFGLWYTLLVYLLFLSLVLSTEYIAMIHK
jgi:hypothetical protein